MTSSPRRWKYVQVPLLVAHKLIREQQRFYEPDCPMRQIGFRAYVYGTGYLLPFTSPHEKLSQATLARRFRDGSVSFVQWDDATRALLPGILRSLTKGDDPHAGTTDS